MKNKRNKTYLGIAVLIFSIEIIIAMKIHIGFIRDTFGDYLATIFIYCGIRYISSLSKNNSALMALFIAFSVEFLQLTPLLETLNLENNKLAKIVLGSTFSILDLIAYTFGILTVLFVENKWYILIKLKSLKLYCKRLIIITILVPIIALCLSNYIIAKSAESLTYYDIKSIPKNKVGLVLGAGKFNNNGTLNLYYKYRIDAAVKLYKAGKIEYIIASGDNGVEYYDEPTTFKNDLMAHGIPENRIFLDYAGFRTLDSIIRVKEIFGQTNITIISQRFHNQRAIFIAKHKGINAFGFNAKHTKKAQFFNKPSREYLARVKAVLDIICNTKAKFYGQKIKIE